MNSMMKILSRYVFSAAGVAFVLLIVNFAVLAAWVVQTSKTTQRGYNAAQIADSLVRSDDGYALSEPAGSSMENNRQWAMLLDNTSGGIIWSRDLPDNIPQHYTLSDVASFSRWYLNDYPVTVWKHPDGLLVLGGEKDSVWKYSITEPMAVMDNAAVWITVILILNALVAVLLALLFGLRLLRALKPLARGIEDMAVNEPVELSTRGLLGDLAAGINKASEQLSRQEAALKKRDDARTRWIAGVSHDIRTPLSLVMGYASELEDDSGLPQDRREQAGVIRRQSERIKTLVSDLNLASKLEYDMQPLRKAAFQLPALLRSIAADFYNGGLDDCYSIDVMISEDAKNAVINGDEELLRRAVFNLITNSIRHNPDGCAIKVTLDKRLGSYIVGVSDNGTGLPQEIIESLKHPIGTAELRSHGLGLAMVRQIAKAHDGTAGFRNLPEGGCAAELCLPS